MTSGRVPTWLHESMLELLDNDVRQIRILCRMFNRHTHKIPSRIQVDVDAFRNLARLLNFTCGEFEKRGIGVLKYVMFMVLFSAN